MLNQNKQQSHEGKSRLYYGYIIVILAFSLLALLYGIFFSYGVFFKPLLFEFNLDKATTSGASSLCLIIIGLLGIVMGRINDKLGPRIVLTFCGLLTGISYMLMSKVGSVWQLYLVYGLILGIGLSGVMVPLLSTVARWFDKRRSLMTGFVVNGSGIGMFIFPLVASRLIALYDWQIAYLIMGGIALVISVLAAQFLRRNPITIEQPINPGSDNNRLEFNSGADGLSLKDAVQTRQFWFVLCLNFFLGFCRFTIFIHIVPHAIEMGLSAITAANVLATLGLMSIIARPSIGVIADRIGNRKVFIMGSILASITFLLLVSAEMQWMLYLIVIIFSFNVGLTASESPLVARLFGLRAHGIIFGVMGVGYTTGAAFGPLLAGYIYDTTGSYTYTFLLCILFSIMGAVLSLLLKPVRDSGPLGKNI